MRNSYKINKAVLFFCALALFGHLELQAVVPDKPKAEPVVIFSHHSLYDVTDRDFTNFNPQMIEMVDQKKGVNFFRGNLPQYDKQFLYQDLIKHITESLVSKGHVPGKSYKLHTICLMNFLAEKEELDVEQEWFKAHRSAGDLYVHPIVGSHINPIDFAKEKRSKILNHQDVDGLKSLMQYIKTLMDAKDNTDSIIYLHCKAGIDRTGEVVACYLMQFKGYSYKQALEHNKQFAKREMPRPFRNAVRWYAFYLKDVLNISTVGQID